MKKMDFTEENPLRKPEPPGSLRRWIVGAVLVFGGAGIGALLFLAIVYPNRSMSLKTTVPANPPMPPPSRTVLQAEKVNDAWLKQVAALPAEKQVEAVVKKMKELNPDCNRRFGEH